ncbi:MAG: hypothetical protein Udaeo2_02230 [Candidatus Udaeobacter sp.]|nr:MAG: hypothetical protein Udaeo2_02230 [Candidatus Udaeobacter sp.]
MHKIRQLVVSQPFLSRRESLQMNTQVMEPDSVVDLIPQIVNLKKFSCLYSFALCDEQPTAEHLT